MLSLALHELATNSLEHGAVDTNGGQRQVRWRVSEGDGVSFLALDWIETGVKRRKGSTPLIADTVGT